METPCLQASVELLERIEGLRGLQNGWLGPHSQAPGRAGLEWLQRQLGATSPEALPTPGVAPTPEGGVFLEWVWPTHRVSVEILLPGHRAKFQAVNLATGDSQEGEADLDAPGAWPAMYAFARRDV